MATETIREYPEQINGIEGARDVIVLVLAATRYDDDGAPLPITAAQKDAALNGAKSVLEVVGAEVAATSTALLIPAETLNDGESLRLTVAATLDKITQDASAEE